MTFKVPRREARVVFEDGDYAGAEARLHLDQRMGDFLALQRAAVEGETETLCHFLADALIDWNLADDEGAIPADYEGVLRLPPLLITAIIAKWLEAQTSVAAPLGGGSINGAGSGAASMPMVSLPASPPN